ncbi:MAG: response regulator transcription factor [Clostridia bacterium]|nr:DNA-binding response regulator [Bacillota bacterium]MBO2520628.1 DNA-binding response regulator [Bacillota bacterium]
MAPRILVIEDDPAISELITYHLTREGMQVLTAADGREALAIFNANHPDLLLLDLMLPGLDGFEVCRRVRQASDVPIIILTAKGQEDDRVRGFELGADDYVTKPFSPKELVARIRAVLRRSHYEEGADNLIAGELHLDLKRRRLVVGGREIELTPKEFDLLALLMARRGQPVSRDTLLEEVWGYQFAGGTRTLDVHIRRLRQKIGDDPQHPTYIETVHGVGYRFKDDVPAEPGEPGGAPSRGEAR